MIKVIVIILFFIIFGFNSVYAEQIFISVTGAADIIIFDGKWTSTPEWKQSSEEKLTFDDGSKMAFRISHNYENIFVMINYISDKTLSNMADMGVICIDSKADGGDYPQKDDYCFLIAVGSKHPITLQGGHFLAPSGYFKKIENHPGLIAAGGLSDENDRYSKTPHITYEFKRVLSEI